MGCYDGTVKVFDVRKKENVHIFMSDIRTGKHTDPVWQVRPWCSRAAHSLSYTEEPCAKPHYRALSCVHAVLVVFL